MNFSFQTPSDLLLTSCPSSRNSLLLISSLSDFLVPLGFSSEDTSFFLFRGYSPVRFFSKILIHFRFLYLLFGLLSTGFPRDFPSVWIPLRLPLFLESFLSGYFLLLDSSYGLYDITGLRSTQNHHIYEKEIRDKCT